MEEQQKWRKHLSEERSILRYSTERTRLVRGGEFEYKLFWIGEETNRGGVDEASDISEARELTKQVI